MTFGLLHAAKVVQPVCQIGTMLAYSLRIWSLHRTFMRSKSNEPLKQATLEK